MGWERVHNEETVDLETMKKVGPAEENDDRNVSIPLELRIENKSS